MVGLEEAVKIAAEDTEATKAVAAVYDGFVAEIEKNKVEIADLKARLAAAEKAPVETDARLELLLAAMKANRDMVVALALRGTAADANANVAPTPITVPSSVPGQPGTTYPQGKELPPFPAPKTEGVDMSPPKPSPGIEPVKPE